jgi:TATA-binding protein-associated factor
MKRIMACRNPKATEAQIKDGEEALAQLHRQVLPFILRRVKSEVLKELPEKVIVDYPCELTLLQRTLYAFVVEHCTLRGESGAVAATRAEEKEAGPLLSPLQTLIALRKLVDHPSLIGDIVARIEPRNPSLNLLRSSNYDLSGKMVALRELMEECQIGRLGSIKEEAAQYEISEELTDQIVRKDRHRALIFCQWKATVEMIAR